MEKMIAQYRKDYIKEMHKVVGHAPLMVTSCGVIIENEKGEILLQKRRDNNYWCIPGGYMEIGEKFIETAQREVLEETGLEIDEPELFGIYSGEDRVIQYPNGDICIGTGIVFKTSVHDVVIHDEEALEHKFFGKENLPNDINAFDKKYIMDWAEKSERVIVD